MELEGLVFFFAFDHHYTIRVVLCFFMPAGGDSYLRDGPPGPQLLISWVDMNHHQLPLHTHRLSTPASDSHHHSSVRDTRAFTTNFGNCRKFPIFTPFPSVVKQSTRSIWNGVQEVRGQRGETRENKERFLNLIGQLQYILQTKTSCAITPTSDGPSTMQRYSIVPPSSSASKSTREGDGMTKLHGKLLGRSGWGRGVWDGDQELSTMGV